MLIDYQLETGNYTFLFFCLLPSLLQIERNSRKNLFPDEKDGTLTKDKSPKPLAKVHKEGDMKPSKASSLTKQFRDMIEEKFQNKSYIVENKPAKDEVDHVKPTTPPTEESKKGLKFGIRVLPTNIFGKSPGKVQADNENNVNLEKSNDEKSMEITTSTTPASQFQRQLSINSSGIKRDAAGIPQEMPEHMMNAAMSAKDNRRGQGKLKAPKPPPVEIDMNVSTETTDTTIDIYSPRPVDVSKGKDQLNFTDNFAELSPVDRPSNSSTPKSHRKKLPSDTESQINARYDNGGWQMLMSAAKMRLITISSSFSDSEADDSKMSNGHIVELSANDITVHQSSEEEDNEENRKTASMGDLSLPVAATRPTLSSGTLERAQSWEMSENGQVNTHPAAPPKKRKAPVVSDSDLSEKEPRLMVTDLDGMEQRGRLKSANEWGNLEDAISSKSSAANTSSDTESSGRMEDSMQMDESVSSLVTEVMAVLNHDKPEKRIEAEIKEFGVKMIDDIPFKTMEQLLKEKLEEAKAALETDEEEEEEEQVPSKKSGGNVETVTFTTTTTLNGTPVTAEPRVATISLKDNIDLSQISPPDSPKLAELTPDTIKMDFERNHLSDEIKVSKFPFGSLERPKSDVLKKVIARKMVPLDDYTTTTTTTTTVITENPQPVSLTLIGGDSSVELNGRPLTIEDSPVYSSDNKGVNSISISSMEVNIVPPAMKANLGSGGVTISTNNSERSQPSSIILIEDEKLDFTLRTPPSELETNMTMSAVPPQPAARNLSGQVFIVDSLSQPKVQIENKTITVTTSAQPEDEEGEGTGEQLSDQDVIDALKTFVTEIDVSNNTTTVDLEKEAAKLALNTTMKFLEHEKLMAAPQPARTSENSHREQQPEVLVAPIPRNAEIKFTTSTYESSTSPKINGGERRHSAHVDQIRSNFERNTNSEIPVPVRKSSIPTLKLSPSKIPVFNSNGGGVGNSGGSSPPSQRFSLTSKSPSPTGIRERSVSAHSIKTSARHPSGK